MAIPTLIELLGEGREAWNRSRREGLSGTLDLRAGYFPNRDFSGYDLSRVNLSRADLSGAQLRDAQFDHADLSAADLSAADLSGAHLHRARLHRASLSATKCRHTNFANAVARHASFVQADLSAADFGGARLSWSDFRWAELTRASLREAHLDFAVFVETSFTGSDLQLAVFNHTAIGLSDLTQAKGLAAVRHEGPSPIDTHTLVRSQNLPELFLKGIGLPDTIITHYHALSAAAAPIQFYSVFISFSSGDEDFARRLHADLQATGVRCWFAPEDLKIGDRFRTRIEESIRVYDKLLIVLSEHSVNSQWVTEEFEVAFEKEGARKQTVLFPIRLDDAVMDTTQAWAASIRRTRHIGDFTKWKDHNAYQKAFQRLMRDLQASADAAAT